MSIASEISRISQNVADSLTAVANKGVTVPTGSNSDDLPGLIAQISQGGGGGVIISDTTDSHGGTIRTITGTQISGTKSITTNGVQDVTSYASVNVQVPSSGGTEFIVTLSKNETTGLWESDKTFSQISTAYSAGKTIAVRTSIYSDECSADGEVHDEEGVLSFVYWVREYFGEGLTHVVETIEESSYTLNSSGLTRTGSYTYIIPDGTLNILQNGTGIDVTNYSSVDVAVSSSPNLQAKTNISPTTSSQTIQADQGFDGLSSVQINAMPSGTAGTPTATKGTVSNHSISVTPSVTNTTGYITGSTKTGTAVTVNVTELESGNKEITENGTNISVSGYSTVSVAVPSSGSKNVQVVQGTTRTNASTLTAIGSELTVSKTGTYDIYYSCMRTNTSSSYTWGTRLYIDGTAYGNETTTWSNNVQNTHLTNISLTANQKLRVYGRNTRGTSYYVYAPMIAIVEQ